MGQEQEHLGGDLLPETMIAIGGNLKTHVDGNTGWVEGLGVMYGSASQKDLEGDYFTENTFYGHNAGNGASATLNHGIPMIKRDTKAHEIPTLEKYSRKQFKNPITTEQTELGILTRHALDLHDEYEAWVFEQTQNGKFKWSSGALAHLVERDDDGQIKRWEIGEFAYTPTPAEWRLPAIAPLKTFKAAFEADEIKATDDNSQETAEETDAQSVDAVEDVEVVADEIKSTESTGENLMAEQEVLNEVLDALKSIEGRIEKIEAQPIQDLGVAADEKPVKAFNVVESTSIGDEKKGYQKAFWDFMHSGGRRAAKALEHGTDAEGGYVVPEDDELSIESIAVSMSAVRQLPVQERTTNGMLYHWPTIDTHTGAMTSTAEEASYNQNDPVFDERLFTIQKYTRQIRLSEELNEMTNSGLQATLNQQFGEALALTENSLLVTRLDAASTGNVNFAGTAAITAAEIVSMYYAGADPYPTNGWLMAKATEGLVRGISGNDFQFLPNPQGQLQGSLLGAPVANASAMPAATTGNESVYCGDFRQVGIVRRGGLSIIFNPWLAQATGQVDFFAKAQFDIQILHPSALVSGTQA